MHASKNALHVVIGPLQNVVLEAIAHKHVVASFGVSVAPSSVSALLVPLATNGRIISTLLLARKIAAAKFGAHNLGRMLKSQMETM
jgi:hypothetical protein